MMRIFSLLVLVVLIAAVAVFVYQNRGDVDVVFLTWNEKAALAAVVGAAYGIGMVSGWSVIGLFRRSLHRVTEEQHARR